MKRSKKLIPIKFVKHNSPYHVGDIAGFTEGTVVKMEEAKVAIRVESSKVKAANEARAKAQKAAAEKAAAKKAAEAAAAAALLAAAKKS